MKRSTSVTRYILLLIVATIFLAEPASGLASYLPSDVPNLPSTSYTLWLNTNKDYIRPQCGPGNYYSTFISKNGNTQLYQVSNITYMNARFCSGDWVYVEFGYTDGVLRFGFFPKALFSPSVPWSSMPSYYVEEGHPGWMTEDVIPYNGPGYHCGDYPSCKLYTNEKVYACMECNGWYLCWFENYHGNNYGFVYLWIPGWCVAWY